MTVLIPYLVFKLLDLGLGHCVFDLELLETEAEKREKIGEKREGGQIIKCMAAQSLTAVDTV